jgi:hypothetical protein
VCATYAGEASASQNYSWNTVIQEVRDRRRDVEERSQTTSPSNWSYSEYRDPIEGGVTKLAEVKSTNSINLPQGARQGTLVLQRGPDNRTRVLFRVEDAQIHFDHFGGSTSSTSVSLRFDNQKADENVFLVCLTPTDHSWGFVTAFMGEEDRILSRIRKAKTLKIEAPLSRESKATFEFEIAGLKW